MKLLLENIGKIKHSEVEINGITVIAGENNTGKSTFGRALFAIFNSFYNVEEQIRSERVESVENLLDIFYRSPPSRISRSPDTNEIARTIVHRSGEYRNVSTDYIRNLLLQYDESVDKRAGKNISLEELTNRMADVVNVSDSQLLTTIISKKLDAEFNGQPCNVFSDEKGEIKLTIRDQEIVVQLSDDTVVDLESSIDLHTEVVYIDDPFVIDDLRFFYRYGYMDHRLHLISKMLTPNSKGSNIVDEIVTGHKFERIYEKISSVCGGDIVRNKRTGMGYKKIDSEKTIDVRNLSTGLKTFIILKLLFLNGALEYNGTIVLDEPEIHLHPEWQLLFAELIVLLQQEFGMHILLNTHSPYFLRAIQVYSEKHGVLDRCKFYLSEVRDEEAIIQDVTDCVDKIYEKLSRPLQALEDLRWENG